MCVLYGLRSSSSKRIRSDEFKWTCLCTSNQQLIVIPEQICIGALYRIQITKTYMDMRSGLSGHILQIRKCTCRKMSGFFEHALFTFCFCNGGRVQIRARPSTAPRVPRMIFTFKFDGCSSSIRVQTKQEIARCYCGTISRSMITVTRVRWMLPVLLNVRFVSDSIEGPQRISVSLTGVL